MREQYCIERTSAQPVFPKKPRKLAATTYRGRPTGRSWFWFGFDLVFWPLFLVFVYIDVCERFVKTLGRSKVEYSLT
jgi:hypothetical protein